VKCVISGPNFPRRCKKGRIFENFHLECRIFGGGTPNFVGCRSAESVFWVTGHDSCRIERNCTVSELHDISEPLISGECDVSNPCPGATPRSPRFGCPPLARCPASIDGAPPLLSFVPVTIYTFAPPSTTRDPLCLWPSHWLGGLPSMFFFLLTTTNLDFPASIGSQYHRIGAALAPPHHP
jgi:hypothetical protein